MKYFPRSTAVLWMFMQTGCFRLPQVFCNSCTPGAPIAELQKIAKPIVFNAQSKMVVCHLLWYINKSPRLIVCLKHCVIRVSEVVIFVYLRDLPSCTMSTISLRERSAKLFIPSKGECDSVGSAVMRNMLPSDLFTIAAPSISTLSRRAEKFFLASV